MIKLRYILAKILLSEATQLMNEYLTLVWIKLFDMSMSKKFYVINKNFPNVGCPLGVSVLDTIMEGNDKESMYQKF